jgi:hypothetical protein
VAFDFPGAIIAAWVTQRQFLDRTTPIAAAGFMAAECTPGWGGGATVVGDGQAVE